MQGGAAEFLAARIHEWTLRSIARDGSGAMPLHSYQVPSAFSEEFVFTYDTMTYGTP